MTFIKLKQTRPFYSTASPKPEKQKVCLWLLIFLCFSKFSFAQTSGLEKRVVRIDSLMNMYYSNFEVAEKEANELYNLFLQKYTGKEYEDLRIRVMLQKSILYSLDAKHHKALEIALEASERANKYKLPERRYHCSWVLATVYEVAGDFEECKKYLDKAYDLYRKNNLEHIYSVYCIRLSSYYNKIGRPDSAVHYARIGLELAQKYHNIREERDAYLLLGAILRESNYKEAVRYRLLAAGKFSEIRDFGSAAVQLASAARILFKNNRTDEAFVYSDSAMAMLGKSETPPSANVFLIRSHLFEAIGSPDSSFYYFRKYHDSYVEEINRMEAFEIKKIDEQYQSEKREAILKNRNLWLTLAVVIAVLVFALALLLLRKNIRIRSQKKVIDRQVEKLQELLLHKQKLAESKSLFYANASHELRTPLTLILEPLNTLLKSEAEPRKRELLSIARQGGATLKDLVDQILDLGKLDGGNMSVYFKPTRAGHFFTVWFTQFESQVLAKELTYNIQNNLPGDLVVMMDQEKCRQIISNLISNALKFTPPGGQIQVTIDYVENQLKLSVKDTGSGIEKSDLPYIFDRYFQAGRKDELAQGGMGIGLALCHDYVTLFGGKLWAESAVGLGSQFYVEFPLPTTAKAPEENILPAEESMTSRPETGKMKKNKPVILIVEDNHPLQGYLQLLLKADYNVLIAEHGEAALERLKGSHNIDLIISDLMMPVMDGYQLVNSLKSDGKTAGIPVIMLTARAEKDARLKALRIGVDDYLTKPFENEELMVRIVNLLENQRIRKEENGERLTASEEDRKWLKKFEKLSIAALSAGQLNVPYLAAEFAMSESTLFRQLKRLTGLSPQQYIQELRLERGRQLLHHSEDYSVQQVAVVLGYKDGRSFSRAFKARFGKLPSKA